jgi:hypothetical protein
LLHETKKRAIEIEQERLKIEQQKLENDREEKKLKEKTW